MRRGRGFRETLILSVTCRASWIPADIRYNMLIKTNTSFLTASSCLLFTLRGHNHWKHHLTDYRCSGLSICILARWGGVPTCPEQLHCDTQISVQYEQCYLGPNNISTDGNWFSVLQLCNSRMAHYSKVTGLRLKEGPVLGRHNAGQLACASRVVVLNFKML